MLKTCLICHKPIKSNFILSKTQICRQCFRRFHFVYKNIKLNGHKCLIIYEYDDFLEENLINLKGYYDISLAKTFIFHLKNILKIKYFGHTILPIPSSEQANKRRGFNHVVEIFSCLDLPIINCFSKTKNIKQASFSKFNRLKISNYIQLDDSKLDPKRRYLLVDDITTTHNSVLTCLKLLEHSRINKVSILIIATKIKKSIKN